MKIDEALAYIHSSSWRTSRLGLERMAELMDRLGNPQRRVKFIHVAGTNGKGSVCAMLSSMLSRNGYKVGLNISPYIQRFNERIQISGEDISDEELISLTWRVGKHAGQMTDHPTEFELITAMAILYFAEKKCDLAILEVGLGGRLDATNIIPPPELAIITAIGLDHTVELGNTLGEIAGEKAGIVKPGTDVLLYPQEAEVDAVVEKVCRENGARLHRTRLDSLKIESATLEGTTFRYQQWERLLLPLLGLHQTKNAAVALSATELLKDKGWTVTNTAIADGLACTSWPARFELVHRSPYVVVDGGHNPQCVDSIVNNLGLYFPGEKTTFVLGVMADKDYEEMLAKILPRAAHIFTVTPDNPRALPADVLAAKIQGMGFSQALSCNSAVAGMESAMHSVGKEGVICAFGSFYMAGALRSYFGKN